VVYSNHTAASDEEGHQCRVLFARLPFLPNESTRALSRKQEHLQSLLEVAAAPSGLVKEVAALTLQPSEPSDEEAASLDRYHRGEKADFTEEQIEALARYETRLASEHTMQPNVLLRFVAERDASVARSLAVLDRVKRAASRMRASRVPCTTQRTARPGGSSRHGIGKGVEANPSGGAPLFL
jgi:hypothetical protein